MDKLEFFEWIDPADGGKPERRVTIVQDPEYTIPGAVILGLAGHGDYQNIVLDGLTALRLADALQARFRRCEWMKDTLCQSDCKGPSYCPTANKEGL